MAFSQPAKSTENALRNSNGELTLNSPDSVALQLFNKPTGANLFEC